MQDVVRARRRFAGAGLVVVASLALALALAWTPRPRSAAGAERFPPPAPELAELALACLGSGTVAPDLSRLSDAELEWLAGVLARLIGAYAQRDFGDFLALRAADLGSAAQPCAHELEELRELGRALRIPEHELAGDRVAVLERFWNAYYTRPPIAQLRPEATRVALHRDGAHADLAAWERSFELFAGLGAAPAIVHRPVVPHRRSIAQVVAEARPLAWLDVELGFETSAAGDGRLCVRFVRDPFEDEWFLHRAITTGTGAPSDLQFIL
jgi:hypothetical protein